MTLSGPVFFPENKELDKAILMLHGYGADGNDLIGLAPILAKSLPGTAFFAPNGIEACEVSPLGRQWFSLSQSDPDFKRRNKNTQKEAFENMYEYAAKAAPALIQYIQSIMETYTLTERQIALLGFSQGTMMALHIGYRHKPSFRCIVGFSGALVGAKRLQEDLVTAPPTLLIHGDQDDMLPPHAVKLAENALSDVNHPPSVVICNNLMHSIDISGLRTAGAFLQKEFEA